MPTSISLSAIAQSRETLYELLASLPVDTLNARKEPMANIVFPSLSALGLMSQMFGLTMKTKEAPEGERYPDISHPVMRVLGGKVYNKDDQVDCYTWSDETFANKASKCQEVGIHGAKAIVALTTVLNDISDENEKLAVADMFARLGFNLLLVYSKAENREYIRVTRELLDMGITHCVNEWTEKKPEEADYSAYLSALEEGDVLILNRKDRTLYRIGRDEFSQTHTLL